jgi:hypothetical protein
VVKAALILLSLLFIIGYFVWYPYLKSRQGFTSAVKDARLTATPESDIDIQSIRANGELFKDIFTFYRKSFGKLFRSAIVLSICATGFVALVHFLTKDTEYYYRNWFFAFQFFNYHKHHWFAVINTLMLTLNAIFVFKYLVNQINTGVAPIRQTFGSGLNNFMKVLIVMSILNAILLWENTFLATLLALVLAPFCIMWMFTGYYCKQDTIESFGHSFSVINTSVSKAAGLFFMLALLGLIFFLLIDSPLLYIYFDILNWNLSINREVMREIILLLMVFTSFLAINLIVPILITGISLVYFSLLEIKEANWLREKVKSIVERK